jgi:hypothetical protein
MAACKPIIQPNETNDNLNKSKEAQIAKYAVSITRKEKNHKALCNFKIQVSGH